MPEPPTLELLLRQRDRFWIGIMVEVVLTIALLTTALVIGRTNDAQDRDIRWLEQCLGEQTAYIHVLQDTMDSKGIDVPEPPKLPAKTEKER